MTEGKRLLKYLLVLPLATVPCTLLVYGVNIFALEQTAGARFSVDLAEVAHSGLPLIVLGTLLGFTVLGRLSGMGTPSHPMATGLLFAACYGAYAVLWTVSRAITGLPFDPIWFGSLPLIGFCHGLLLWVGVYSERGSALMDRFFRVRV